MSPKSPLSQAQVRAVTHRQASLGRVYITEEEVFYFPETPPRWSPPLVAIGTALMSVVLLVISSPMSTDQMAVFSTPRGRYTPDMAALFITWILGCVLLMTAAVQFWVWVRDQRYSNFNARESAHTNTYLGMSLADRFELSPNAARFRLDDIQSIKGKRKLKIRTFEGDCYQFKGLSNRGQLKEQLQQKRRLLTN